LADAQTYEEAGMHEEAMRRYKDLYQSKPQRPEAHIKLRNTAQYILDRYYADARMLSGQGKYDRALEMLDEARSFSMQNQWLDLNEPMSSETLKAEIHQALADQYYREAEQALKEERWEKAKDLIAKSRRYNRDREELEYLDLMVRILPEFRRGMKAKELGLYQEAYYYFEKVANIDADFSNVLQHMQECLDKSSFTVTYVHYTANGKNSGRDKAIITTVKQEVLALDNPFIRLVARDDIDVLIEEQLNSMSGVFDEEAAVEAGKLLGAEYVVVGEVLNTDLRLSPVKSVQHKGWAGPTTQARKVEYTERRRDLTHIVSFRYHLMNAETGEVLAAENIPYTYTDELNWIDYNGDPDQLYPGDWKFKLLGSSIDRVDTDTKAKAEIDELLMARRQALSEAELEQHFIQFIGAEIAHKLEHYANERSLD
jgi:hypothetical protein